MMNSLDLRDAEQREADERRHLSNQCLFLANEKYKKQFSGKTYLYRRCRKPVTTGSGPRCHQYGQKQNDDKKNDLDLKASNTKKHEDQKKKAPSPQRKRGIGRVRLNRPIKSTRTATIRQWRKGSPQVNQLGLSLASSRFSRYTLNFLSMFPMHLTKSSFPTLYPSNGTFLEPKHF